MKKPKVEDLVMARLFPSKKDIDPTDWQTHIRRNLVLEVRAETLCFYGPGNSLESQYPGLNYNKPAHRLRLGRFPCHRKLFRVFNELRLTDNEIQKLCKWEGTRWARETFEAKNETIVKDLTSEDMEDYTNMITTASRASQQGHVDQQGGDIVNNGQSENEDEEMGDSEDEDDGEISEAESDDGIQQSVGVELNQRLLAATEARARGEEVILDADWEQWLKEAAERGAHPNVSDVADPTTASQNAPATPVYWGRDIPEYLSDNPSPQIAAVQVALPPPPNYTPRERSYTLPAPTTASPVAPSTDVVL